MMKFKILAIVLFLIPANLFAWNSVGHRIIAQIAYDQLTPTTKAKVDALTKNMFDSQYPDARFLKASTWPDEIRTKTSRYNSWHFIDLPFVKNNATPEKINQQNVVTEIQRAEKIVPDTSQTLARRAKYLSFLVHFVGDIHQPLHCAILYDDQFPHGLRQPDCGENINI